MPLPEYQDPPVIEVVCGLQLNPVEHLLAPHLGLLWQSWRNEFPTCQEVAPLVLQSLSLEEGIELLTDVPPLPRVWFIHSKNDRLVQIQRDMFMYNWRKVSESAPYPRYNAVFAEFMARFEDYSRFLNIEKLEAPVVKQFELTYVNHIPASSGWDRPRNIGFVIRDQQWTAGHELLNNPKSFDNRISFDLPLNAGKLSVRTRNAIRQDDKEELLILELTARGPASTGSIDGMHEWFGLAHEWIVRGFTELTTETMHQKWGRTQ